MKNSF